MQLGETKAQPVKEGETRFKISIITYHSSEFNIHTVPVADAKEFSEIKTFFQPSSRAFQSDSVVMSEASSDVYYECVLHEPFIFQNVNMPIAQFWRFNNEATLDAKEEAFLVGSTQAEYMDKVKEKLAQTSGQNTNYCLHVFARVGKHNSERTTESIYKTLLELSQQARAEKKYAVAGNVDVDVKIKKSPCSRFSCTVL